MLCNFPGYWAFKMYQKTFLIILLNTAVLYGQSLKLHPMAKSALMPGWGESAQGKYLRARVFRISELFLWTSCVGAYAFSRYERSSYEAFAAEHAGINSEDKNHQYWVDIGNYQNITLFNEEHLRFREPEDIYRAGTGFDWAWDTDSNRKKFEDMRIHSDGLALTGKFLIGAVVLNHIVSAIDALYLTRLERIQSIALNPVLHHNGDAGLNMNITFVVL